MVTAPCLGVIMESMSLHATAVSRACFPSGELVEEELHAAMVNGQTAHSSNAHLRTA
jgi:hypothetical protein